MDCDAGSDQTNDVERLREVMLDLERSRRIEADSRGVAEALVRCLRALAVGSEPDAMFAALLSELRAVLDADCAFVLLAVGEDPDRLDVIAVSGDCPPGGRWRRGPLLRRLEVNRPIAAVFDVTRLEEWHDHLADGGTASALHLSLGGGERPAVLVCGSRERGHFTDRHVALAGSLAPVAAQAIARANDHLRLLAEIAGRARVAEELRRSQEALVHLRKMEAVSQLAGGLAHEINTPLQYVSDSLRFISTSFNGINNLVPTLSAWLEPHMDKEVLAQFLEMADYDYLAKELPKAIEQCQEGLERVGGIVRTLKLFAENEAGDSEPADLNGVLRTTLDICRAELGQVAEVVLDLHDLPAVPCRIGELRQVFYNLLINAARAIADHGGARGVIAISTRRIEDSVEVAIRDDGCGMDAEVLRRACEPFFTTRPVGQGMGQGLAIAHQVVHRHGGTLSLASQAGAGTTATVRLPLPAGIPAAPPADAGTQGQRPGAGAFAGGGAGSSGNQVADAPRAGSPGSMYVIAANAVGGVSAGLGVGTSEARG